MNCDEILKQGIFNTIIIDYQKKVNENLYEWLTKSEFKAIKEAQDAGLNIGLPIKGVPLQIGGSFTEDEFSTWKSDVASGKARQFSESEVLSIINKSVSQDIVNAWLECIKSTIGNQTGLIYKVEADENNSLLIFNVRWIPNSINDLPPQVITDGFQVTGADILTKIPDGTEVPLSGLSAILKPTTNQAIAIVLNTTKGSISEIIDAPDIKDPTIEVLVHIEEIGDIIVPENQWAGTKGQGRRLEGFQINFTEDIPNLSIRYMAHLQDVGDTPFFTEGQFCGTRNQSRRLEGFTIELTGADANKYIVSYKAHIEGIGDTPFSSNGEFCGTRNQSKRVEAILVVVKPR